MLPFISINTVKQKEKNQRNSPLAIKQDILLLQRYMECSRSVYVLKPVKIRIQENDCPGKVSTKILQQYSN